MSTFYTWATELIWRNEEKVNEVEKELKEEGIEYTRHDIESGATYFTGLHRNLGGGFYEAVCISARLVWIDDEGGHGVSE